MEIVTSEEEYTEESEEDKVMIKIPTPKKRELGIRRPVFQYKVDVKESDEDEGGRKLMMGYNLNNN